MRSSPRLNLSFFAIFMAAWLFICSGFQFLPRTAVGVQCPTAPIQTVTVAKRDCCGKVVGYESRAPGPGEAGFMQCRCAEKKAGQQQLAAAPKLDPFLTTVAQIELAPRANLQLKALREIQSFGFHQVAPPTRPPDQTGIV